MLIRMGYMYAFRDLITFPSETDTEKFNWTIRHLLEFISKNFSPHRFIHPYFFCCRAIEKTLLPIIHTIDKSFLSISRSLCTHSNAMPCKWIVAKWAHSFMSRHYNHRIILYLMHIFMILTLHFIYTINLYGEYPAAFHRPMMNIKCCSKRMGDTHKKSATSENMQSRYCYCYCSHLVTVICSFDPLSSLHSDIFVTKTMRILHNVNCNQLQTVFC